MKLKLHVQQFSLARCRLVMEQFFAQGYIEWTAIFIYLFGTHKQKQLCP